MIQDEYAQRWTRIGALSAFALLLGYVETFVPIPIPGVKLGLANVAILAALEDNDARGATCIALIKVLATGLLFGSPISMAYSAVGTMLSLATMIPLSRLRTMRLWMTSIVGALFHEVGQLIVAQLVLRTPTVWYLLPILMVAGCVTGALCGIWATSLTKAIPHAEEFPVPAHLDLCLAPCPPSAHTILLVIVTSIFALWVLHVSTIVVLLACGACALAACIVARVPLRDLAHMVPLLLSAAFLSFSLHLIATQWPPGTALHSMWQANSLHTALVECARATACLANLLLASRAFAALIKKEHLAGGIAWAIQPLLALGLHTEGFVLAFDVALRLIPLLAEGLQIQHMKQLRIKDLRQELPSMIRDACLEAARL